jgi:hypothetical protein
VIGWLVAHDNLAPLLAFPLAAVVIARGEASDRIQAITVQRRLDQSARQREETRRT